MNEAPSLKLTKPDEEFELKLGKALRLKDFALQNNYRLDEEDWAPLNKLRLKRINGPTEITSDDWDQLDGSISRITQETYPISIDTLSADAEPIEYKRFRSVLVFIGISALLLAVWSALVSIGAFHGMSLVLGNSVLAIALGLLGACVYMLFAVIGEVPARTFKATDEFANYGRMILGALLGWLFYFAFGLEAFAQLRAITESNQERGGNFVILLLPFLVGYSTKFVIGLLERIIAAAEISLGLEGRPPGRTLRRKPPR